MKDSNKNNHGGIPTNLFAFPLLIFVVIMHLIIIYIIIDTNHSSDELSLTMQRTSEYQIDATSMQSTNTIMSETCSTYIQTPIDINGNSNFGSLLAYSEQVNADGRAPKVVERFKQYDVSNEVFICIKNAATASDQLVNIQIHAISLMSSVYPLPDIPELKSIPKVELTTEEIAMSSDERIAYAKQLILKNDYVQLRSIVAQNITKCNNILQIESNEALSASQKHISSMRIILWFCVIMVILLLSVTYFVFYFYTVKPLQHYTKEINDNQKIKKYGGFSEMRQLISAFNKQLDRRTRLESILRTAAENDALTGLPNRYCMEQDLLKNDNFNGPLTILLFDVNYLKTTNDTKGHLAGDNLLIKVGKCIKKCFGKQNDNNCYRIGGDEFIALMYDCPESTVKNRIELFKTYTEREDIDVAVGYAHTDKMENGMFKELMEKADRNMYEQKRKTHYQQKSN